VDGVDWVFGGKTTRRAGRKGRYGDVASPVQVQDGRIVCSYRLGDLKVTQQLSFVKSPTTRYLDTARIHYIVENVGQMTHAVGLRLLIDTMLGANDGAPLRAADQAMIGDAMLSGARIPDYWQAFDSLIEPSVTSQGTMAGGELTPPSRVAFSNWGMFADNLWDAEIVPGREFIRSRESDLDSAVAMYWDPSALAPGEVRHYVTYYGLGGITLAPGKLALGITAPAEVGLSSDGTAPFLAVAYVHNTGEGPAHDLVARLDLPSGFKLAGGQSNTHSIGDLEPGQTAQVAWQVVATWASVGRADLAVSVSAKNADANAVSREIQVLGPPRLLASIRRVEALQVRDERLYPWPARVSVRVENTGGSDANWVKVRLDSLGDFALSGGDHRELLIGSLQPNQGQDISWMLGGEPRPGEQRIVASATAQNAAPSASSASIQVPQLKPRVWIRPEKERVKAGDIVRVDVMLTNIVGVDSFRLDLSYDSDLLGLAMVSRGGLAVAGKAMLPWEEGDSRSLPGRIQGMAGRVGQAGKVWGSVATVYFLSRQYGSAVLSIENLILLDASGRAVTLPQAPAPCTVQISR
ncbi:MAG TPA: hypothetical protein PLG65_09155, partial [Bacillota bacterium]|nr:hypothetical protein [Bacillota bacterium]